jgi:hypothetical protein
MVELISILAGIQSFLVTLGLVFQIVYGLKYIKKLNPQNKEKYLVLGIILEGFGVLIGSHILFSVGGIVLVSLSGISSLVVHVVLAVAIVVVIEKYWKN